MIKGLFRSVLLSGVSLWVLSEVLGGVVIGGDFWVNLGIGAVVLVGLDIVLRPILSLLLLPFNLLSFGALKWVAPLVVFYLGLFLVNGIEVGSFPLGGIWGIPEFGVSGIWGYFVLAYLYRLVIYAVEWLFE